MVQFQLKRTKRVTYIIIMMEAQSTVEMEGTTSLEALFSEHNYFKVICRLRSTSIMKQVAIFLKANLASILIYNFDALCVF